MASIRDPPAVQGALVQIIAFRWRLPDADRAFLMHEERFWAEASHVREQLKTLLAPSTKLIRSPASGVLDYRQPEASRPGVLLKFGWLASGSGEAEQPVLGALSPGSK